MGNTEKEKRALEKVFVAIPEFREWILGTKLFSAILEYSGRPEVTLVGFEDAISPHMMMELSCIRITEPEELPQELIIEFLRNSPFCNPLTLIKLLSALKEGLELRYKQSLLN